MSKPGREVGAADGLAEDPRVRWPGRRTAVLPTIVAAASVWMVAVGGPLIVVASSPADHLVVVPCLASVVEAVMQQGDPVDC